MLGLEYKWFWCSVIFYITTTLTLHSQTQRKGPVGVTMTLRFHPTKHQTVLPSRITTIPKIQNKTHYIPLLVVTIINWYDMNIFRYWESTKEINMTCKPTFLPLNDVILNAAHISIKNCIFYIPAQYCVPCTVTKELKASLDDRNGRAASVTSMLVTIGDSYWTPKKWNSPLYKQQPDQYNHLTFDDILLSVYRWRAEL